MLLSASATFALCGLRSVRKKRKIEAFDRDGLTVARAEYVRSELWLVQAQKPCSRVRLTKARMNEGRNTFSLATFAEPLTLDKRRAANG